MQRCFLAATMSIMAWAILTPASWLGAANSQTVILSTTGIVNSSQICTVRGSGNFYAKTFTVSLTSGNQYTINLHSTANDANSGVYETDCDTFLYLVNSSGTIVAENDDVIPGGGGTGAEVRSLIMYDATVSGTYTIVCTSWAPMVSYPFQLTVTDRGIVSGGTTSGNLIPDPNNPRGPGFYSLRETVTLTAGQAYQIDVVGNGNGGTYENSIDYLFSADTVAYLLDSSGNVLMSDDNYGNGFASQLTFTPTTTGSYTIVATSFSPGATFGVQITVTALTPPPPPPPPPPGGAGIPNVRLTPSPRWLELNAPSNG